ncbi:porin [Herbaspirillum sp. HC18]|nr:porin [Herbaspirillum sp. HC18]
MKKTLLALATLGTLGAFAGTASAQSNVTIYGIVDAGIQYEKNFAVPDKVWKLESGIQSGSRVGFKGSEDLGAGLSAIFTLENGFNEDTGTLGQGGRLFGRQAWVGFNSNSFGSVKLGRQQTPLYFALLSLDPFGIGLAGNAQRIFGAGLYAADPFSRSDNTLLYATPTWAGFNVQVGYGFGEAAGSLSPSRQILAGASYIAGPINVQFAYQDANTATLPANTAFLGSGVANLKTYLLGATWDFRVVKAHVAISNTEIDLPAASPESRTYMVGATVPIGTGSLLASYTRNDVRDISDGVSNQYALGYVQPLSKRTNLYTSISRTDNESGVRVNAAANGLNGTLFNVGMRHQF